MNFVTQKINKSETESKKGNPKHASRKTKFI